MHPLFLRVGVPLAGAAIITVAWYRFGWQGVAIVGTAIMMWALLHFNRMMQVLKRAANRPIGYVDSAVMLNAKLKPGVSLMHVVAMTRALGALQSAKDTQPEIYRWTDGSMSTVDAEFSGGRLVRWQMTRPPPTGDETQASASAHKRENTGSPAP
jgi:hypothetical protein